MLTIRSDTAQARDIDRKRFSGIEYLVPESDAIGAAGNPFAVGDDKATDGLLHVLGGYSVQQGHGAGEVLRHEKVIAMRGERHEHIIFTIIAADYDLDPRIDPVMAPTVRSRISLGLMALLSSNRSRSLAEKFLSVSRHPPAGVEYPLMP